MATDAFIFILHVANPVSNLSLDEIRNIYEGRVTDWRVVRGHGERTLKTTDSEPITRYVRKPKEKPPNGAAKKEATRAR